MVWRTALATIALAIGVLLTGETIAQTQYPTPVMPNWRQPFDQPSWDEMHRRNLEKKIVRPNPDPDRLPTQQQNRSCSEIFVDCNAAGRPYNFCSQQLESCTASRR
jgi:hypothetical protein